MQLSVFGESIQTAEDVWPLYKAELEQNKFTVNILRNTPNQDHSVEYEIVEPNGVVIRNLSNMSGLFVVSAEGFDGKEIFFSVGMTNKCFRARILRICKELWNRLHKDDTAGAATKFAEYIRVASSVTKLKSFNIRLCVELNHQYSDSIKLEHIKQYAIRDYRPFCNEEFSKEYDRMIAFYSKNKLTKLLNMIE